ncbi:RagB/SusD family nutrient uptake outer membrane protein [Parapedobacter deserti]|uniref:RagB/SusD family nutrient uptake outer membrane protein n=1 Tax=Parapedobacter deserti TaxID=1912957 RepID=A0ABV7JI66_9SPHI
MKSLIIKILLAVAICNVLISCNKALEIRPTDFIAAEYYYNNEEQLNTALNGVYEVLGREVIYRSSGNSLFTAFEITDDVSYSASATGIAQKYDYTSSFRGVYDIWRTLYIGVEKSNMLLANINKPQMDESRRRVIEGQARFLRAYYYFLLVSNFGDVPLRTKPTESVKDVYAARTPAKEVYQFIIDEMTMAEGMVLPITEYGHSGRVSKSAVQAILARVCLYNAGYPHNDASKYAEALKWANKVIDSKIHSLVPDYSKLYVDLIQDRYNIEENIWEVEFYSIGNTDPHGKTGGVGVGFGIRQNNIQLGFSPGSYGAQAILFNKYDDADLRRDWAIAPYSYQGNNTLIKVPWTPNQLYERRIGKFRREYELTTNKINNYNSTNYPVIRYSDVLLMAAEAEYEAEAQQNPSEFAKKCVNEVRQRAYGSGKTIKSFTIINGGAGYTTAPIITVSGGVDAVGIDPVKATAVVQDGRVTAVEIISRGTFYTGTPTVTLTGGDGNGAIITANLSSTDDSDLTPADLSDFRKVIQDERSRELCFEGLRRMDLIRWGIFVPTLKAVANHITLNAPTSLRNAADAGNNVTDKYIYLPIPLSELALNNLLVQNNGF